MGGRALLAGVAVALAGCSLIVNLGDLGDAGASDVVAPDVGADVVPCLKGQGTAGPTLIQVDIGNVCIDSTEVTVAQYNQFLDAGALVDAPSRCSWNTSYAPQTDGSYGCTPDKTDLATRANYPISCVDWCDAWSFCAWAGKRLCGSTTGGPLLSLTNSSDLQSSQWFIACATYNKNVYPTGATYTTGDCNTQGGDGAVPVASLPKCQGGYPGIYDLAGNLEEWVDSCKDQGDADPKSDPCNEEGDTYMGPYAPSGIAQCSNVDYDRRDLMHQVIGFRCCSL
jgi:formylglycine-generating enzyme required for sulfatase activity